MMLVAVFATIVAGCATTPAVKIQTVEVPKYVHAKIDARYLAPCVYAEPDPACFADTKREFCNGQLKDIRLGYRDALNRCNADKAAIKDADK
jgi:hypothetical protein